MQPAQALRIIQSLANGLDPHTNRELPPGTPFEQPQVIRALFAAARALETAAQNEPAATPISPATDSAPTPPPAPAPPISAPLPAPIPKPIPALPVAAAPAAPVPAASLAWEDRPANAGKPWGRDEDARLCNGFERGVSLETLAQIHARTPASIQSRLEKLGKIMPSTPSTSDTSSTPSST